MATTNSVIRQLAIRENHGTTVELSWNSETEEISCRVFSASEDFTLRDIPKDRALDAFEHPYAYADWALHTGRYDVPADPIAA